MATDPPRAIDEAMLRDFLADRLPQAEMARVERALRESAQLNALCQKIRLEREGIDPLAHSLGAIWIRHRLTCPTRSQWSSYLLGLLEDDLADYMTFHLNVVGCEVCRANYDDLRDLAARAAGSDQPFRALRDRILRTGRDLLPSESDGE